MKFRFAHIADVHLGNQQYGLKERFNDFGRAWIETVQRAVAARVNLVVIAGDLFDRRTVEPLALLQATAGLILFRNAGIPVMAVEGNHERGYYRENMSWMDYLAQEGYLRLLHPVDAQGKVSFSKASQDAPRAPYFDVGPVRVMGQPYLGSAAPSILREVGQALSAMPRPEYAIYLCHAGLDGVMPNYNGCVAYEQVQPIRPHVDYLALGHIHLKFERDGWVYNPGSLETCSVDEVDRTRGFYLVDVDTDRPERHLPQHQIPTRRAFIRIRLDMGRIGSPEELISALRTEVARRGSSKEAPVVELSLVGRLRFDRGDLVASALRSYVMETMNPLHVDVKNHTELTEFEVEEGEPLSKDALELRVLSTLFARDDRYREKADDWAQLAADLKQMALAKTNSEALIQALEAGLEAIG